MGIWEGIAWGIAGGIASEFYKWWSIRDEIEKKKLPDRLKSGYYWFLTIGMIFFGGGIVALYMRTGAAFNAVVAAHIGASAPLFLSSISSRFPLGSPGKTD